MVRESPRIRPVSDDAGAISAHTKCGARSRKHHTQNFTSTKSQSQALLNFAAGQVKLSAARQLEFVASKTKPAQFFGDTALAGKKVEEVALWEATPHTGRGGGFRPRSTSPTSGSHMSQ